MRSFVSKKMFQGTSPRKTAVSRQPKANWKPSISCLGTGMTRSRSFVLIGYSDSEAATTTVPEPRRQGHVLLSTQPLYPTGFISQPLITIEKNFVLFSVETSVFEKINQKYASRKSLQNSVLHTQQVLPVAVTNWFCDQQQITCREASYFFVFMRFFQSIFKMMKRGAPTFKSWKLCFCLRAFEHFGQISGHLSLYPVKERTTLVNHQMLKYLVYFKMGTVIY